MTFKTDKIIDAVLRESNIVDPSNRSSDPVQEAFDNYMQDNPEEDKELTELIGKLYN